MPERSLPEALSRSALPAAVIAALAVLILGSVAVLLDTRSGLAPAGDRVDARAATLSGSLDGVAPARAARILEAARAPARLTRDGDVIARTGPDALWEAGSAGALAGLSDLAAGWSVGDGHVSATRVTGDGALVEARGGVSPAATSVTPAIWVVLAGAVLVGLVAFLVATALRRRVDRALARVEGRVVVDEARLRAHEESIEAGIEVLTATITPLPIPVAAATGVGRLVRNDALAALSDDLAAGDAATIDGAVARGLSGSGPMSDRVDLTDGRAMSVESWSMPVGRVAAVVDRTEQERLAELRRRISAGAARRLRAPLSELHTLAAEMNATAPAAQATPAARMLAIVDRLRGLANSMVRGTEHDPAPLSRPERIGTSGLLWGVARGHEDRLREVGLRLEIEVSDETPPIWADLSQLQDVLASLVANAERFTPVGGTITLWAAPGRDDRVLVGVRDTGPGVGPAELRAVFEPFVRGAESMGRPGNGLGLSGARAVTERLGGSLSIEPGRDGGPRLDLPAAPGTPKLDAPVVSAA